MENCIKLSNTLRDFFEIEISEIPDQPHKVSQHLFSKSIYSRLPDSKFFLINPSALSSIGIDLNPNELEEFLKIISGEKLNEYGLWPLSHNYSGYQYGTYVGQLGDGRSVSIGDLFNQNSERWEINLKGTGKTAYSRTADGRSMLRSCVKEFLFCEYMHQIGGPTTRAFAVLGSFKELVERDLFFEGENSVEPSGILCRLANSFVRFGSFELLLEERIFHGEGWQNKEILNSLLKKLMDFVIKYHFKHINPDDPLKYEHFFQEVVRRVAKMVAFWQTYGFCHGTLNTDNMSVLGITLDYETSGFMETYDTEYNSNSMDIGQRYSFNEQPNIIVWNFMKFAEAIKNVSDYNKNIEFLKNVYAKEYIDNFKSNMYKRMGFFKYFDGDWALVNEFLKLLKDSKADYTLSFRLLCFLEFPLDFNSIKKNIQEVCKNQINEEFWIKFLEKYETRIGKEEMIYLDWNKKMKNINPKFVLRAEPLRKSMEIMLKEEGNMTEILKIYEEIKESFI